MLNDSPPVIAPRRRRARPAVRVRLDLGQGSDTFCPTGPGSPSTGSFCRRASLRLASTVWSTRTPSTADMIDPVLPGRVGRPADDDLRPGRRHRHRMPRRCRRPARRLSSNPATRSSWRSGASDPCATQSSKVARSRRRTRRARKESSLIEDSTARSRSSPAPRGGSAGPAPSHSPTADASVVSATWSTPRTRPRSRGCGGKAIGVSSTSRRRRRRAAVDAAV